MAEVFADLREEMGAGVDEDDAVIGAGDVGVEAVDVLDEVEHLAGGFDAGVAAADDDEGEEALDCGFVALEVGLFEAVDEGAAELLGIADALHEEGVLGHAGDAAEIDDAAEGEDEVAEADGDGGAEHAGVEGEGAGGEIDVHDAAAEDVDVAAEGADGIDDVVRGDGGAGDLCEHGLEDHVIVIGDDADALSAFGAAKLALEGLGAVDTGKAAAGDEDVEV
jgi:hypothetical protein